MDSIDPEQLVDHWKGFFSGIQGFWQSMLAPCSKMYELS